METGLTRNKIIAELSRSPHGKLEEYLGLGKQATKEQPEFMAHLIAWDRLKGQVRDAKVALPLVSLMVSGFHEEFVENSLAHISLLGPREMLRGLRFLDKNRIQGRQLTIKKVMGTSLLEREKNWPKWERTMLQHRAVLLELFSILHVQPKDQRTKACLFKYDKIDGKKVRLPYPEGGLFEIVARLKDMSTIEAAGNIIAKRIPFLIALGALGEKAKEPDLVLALIKSMTATELTTNISMLEKLGVKTNPALRGAFQEALEKAGKSTANVLKATRAAENIDDEELRENLRGLQEKQVQTLGGVEGRWGVFGDKSGSMSQAIEAAREIAGTLAKMVKDKVWLIFFDTAPTSLDVTGMSLDAIKKLTRHVQAGGGTSIGCALLRLLDANEEIDGIVIVSDGEENTAPEFHDVYQQYADRFGKQPPVYFYWTNGSGDFVRKLNAAGIDVQTFDLRGSKLDFYSLPNLIKTMRISRYSLADEILGTRLLTLSDAYRNTAKAATA